MRSVSSRIWTRVAVSISYEDNHYTTGTSWFGVIVLDRVLSLCQIELINHLTVCKQITDDELLVLRRNSWNHLCANKLLIKLFVFDRNTQSHIAQSARALEYTPTASLQSGKTSTPQQMF